MASLNSMAYARELSGKGWKYQPRKELIFGDAQMIDPITGKVHHVFDAKVIQDKRELENGNSRVEKTIDNRNEERGYTSDQCS